MGEEVDFLDETCSQSDFHVLSVSGSEGVYTTILRLSSISLDGAVVYLLLGDFILFDFFWTSGCPSWNQIALPDFILNTLAIQWYGSIDECFSWIEMECGWFSFDWHWFGDMFEIIYVADQSYGSESGYSFMLVYGHETVHLHLVLLFNMCGWLLQGERSTYSFITCSGFYRLIWDPSSDCLVHWLLRTMICCYTVGLHMF